MKSLSEMSHYEILEVAPDAEPTEVDRAYRIAAATYDDDSLATYSVYEESEVAAIRERIEHAYRVLADNEARTEYDSSLGGIKANGRAESVEIALDFDLSAETPRAEVAPEIEEFTDIEGPNEGTFDGARLRRTRLSRGIDLAKIASVTKINTGHLVSIEEEGYGDLPADVYVRGFVVAYARCVGLDPESVALSYMERLRAGRQPAPSKPARRL